MNRTRNTARPVAATDLARAFRRALAEHLFAYPRPDGRWTCKHYTIDVTGPQPTDVDCDCADAVFRERLCKHAVPVVFCRLYGLLPFPPGTGSEGSVLPDCLGDFVARVEALHTRAAA